ncbi:DUF4258 domain-containing protein [Bordetella genomosp. 13]|uniref:DUF4258 domain-containing protein n=1 Tax=Bordetella genomosp. 13 TaxID=463040 RepID=UPI001C92EEF5|nr:DUF4258 domain-containing protein [Bordetella genomosp. 13]
MADFSSRRFGKNVWVTHHAKRSMNRRNVSLALLQHVIEHGRIKRQNALHCWVFDDMADRKDNLICAAIVEQHAIIIKTVMINWELEE